MGDMHSSIFYLGLLHLKNLHTTHIDHRTRRTKTSHKVNKDIAQYATLQVESGPMQPLYWTKAKAAKVQLATKEKEDNVFIS